jgi:hypothetical protein
MTPQELRTAIILARQKRERERNRNGGMVNFEYSWLRVGHEIGVSSATLWLIRNAKHVSEPTIAKCIRWIEES